MAAYAGFMTHVTCRLTAKNKGSSPEPTLGSRVWATFFIKKSIWLFLNKFLKLVLDGLDADVWCSCLFLYF